MEAVTGFRPVCDQRRRARSRGGDLRQRDADDPHRDHATAFGFSVADLDGTHARAVAAGAREQFSPVEEAGLPRHSRFQDPSGNRIVLWQA